MKERGILFSAPMVRALLAGTKTQTRRVLKLSPGVAPVPGRVERECPYGQPGDRLWVRETYLAWGRWETRYSAKKRRDEWHFVDMTQEADKVYQYCADGADSFAQDRSGVTPQWWKRPALFMPRAASRLLLEVTGVRVERLQEISDADAIAEGIEGCGVVINGRSQGRNWRDYSSRCEDPCEWFSSPIDSYRSLWESINGADSWAVNPWVWAVEFRRIT